MSSSNISLFNRAKKLVNKRKLNDDVTVGHVGCAIRTKSGKIFTGISVRTSDTSWQRGDNENSNGLIRRYIPKKIDVMNIEQYELDDMIREINNKPKKCWRFRKPQGASEEEL